MSDTKNVYRMEDGNMVVDPEALETTGANTSITLFYRDASNYKSVSTHVIAGRVDGRYLQALIVETIDMENDGPSIYPENLGLPHPILSHGLAYDESDDHAIVSIDDVHYTDAAPTLENLDAEAFGEKVSNVAENGWNAKAAVDQIDPPSAGYRV